MKRLLMILILFVGLGHFANASVYIQYTNKDSKSYKFDVKIAGVITTVEFQANRTSSVTIDGSVTECIVFSQCGEIRLNNNVQITISNGCISIN